MSVVKRRLAALAEQYALPPAAVSALRALLAALESDPTAPTTVRSPRDAVDAHVADALVALELDAVRGASSVADVGSGAGFPGLALACALPDAAVALVEASSRKCRFLERAIEAMGIANAQVVCERAESWATAFGTRDLVTARAVAPLAVLVEYAAPLLAVGGTLVAWKGRRDAGEEADGAAAAAATGLERDAVRAVRPWDGAEHLHLHSYVKTLPTPARFPRRPGIASKRPLRAAGDG